MALQTNFCAAKTVCSATKAIYVFLSKKFPPSKFELDSRLIFFYVGKVGASLWGEVKIVDFDLLHLA